MSGALLPQAGDVLAGKFRVERVLGVGGMGVVVCAHHLQLDERVAIKFLRPEASQNPEAVARFDREARAAVKIKSEHVARVTDVGRLDDGTPYMVMEYLEGRDLQSWLQERGPLPVEQAVEFVLQALEAIADAHVLGIIHRDLKPSNLFCLVRSDGLPAVKVLDFGISKLTGISASGPDMGMTRTQSLMGSPLYMSPEQMQASKGVDVRADIWAVGVILFELVTGRVPFTGEHIPDLVLNIVTGPTPSAGALRPDVPLVLDRIITRCLEKDRALRFANVGELATALAEVAPRSALASVEKIGRIMHNAGVRTAPLAPTQVLARTNPTPAATNSSWGRTAPTTGRRTTAVVGLGVVLVAATVGGVFVVARSLSHSRTPSATAVLAPPPATSAVPAPLPVPAASLAPLAAASTPARDTESEPPPPASASAAPQATPPAAQPLPTALTSKPVVAPGAADARPSAAKAKPTCSAVPFTDSEGNVHFKQVCR